MQFGFLGIDYKNADLTIRDEISFMDQKKLEFFHKAEGIGVEQVMILSTCNRSEIYYFFDDEQQIKKNTKIYTVICSIKQRSSNISDIAKKIKQFLICFK